MARLPLHGHSWPVVSLRATRKIRLGRLPVAWLVSLLVLGLAGMCCGCNGIIFSDGTPDFSLSVNATSLSLTAGGSAQPVSVSATAINGFTGTIPVTISGLPTGVTASPASFTLTPGTPQQVNFTAAASAAAGTSTVVFTGTSGTLSHTASFSLTVTAAVANPNFRFR